MNKHTSEECFPNCPAKCCALLLILTLACLLSSSILWGQSSNRGALVGIITDPSGAVVPGAEVAVTNVATGVVRLAVANEEGGYGIDFLLPGEYRLTAVSFGFKRSELSGLIVKVGEALRVDVRLELGGTQETVEVSAGASAPVNVATAGLGETIDSAKVENLPLNGREFIQLAALLPGAESGNPKRGVVDNKYSGAISFNGARSGYNSYQVDGAESTDTNNNSLISSPALEAIREFRVDTNMYSAKYGRSGGAIISVVTKSGTNDLHGSLYEYHRNKALDALPMWTADTRKTSPAALWNQFGAAVGGPIVKNRTFFFASAEFFRQKKPGSVFSTFAPTDKEKVGDLTATINPYSARPAVLINPYTQQKIDGNVLPKNLISPAGQKLMDIWAEYKPNVFDNPFLNLRFSRPSHNKSVKWLARIDHNFNTHNMIGGTFNFGDYDRDNKAQTTYGDWYDLQHDRTMVLTYTRILSRTMVNDLTFSHTWYRSGQDYNYDSTVLAGQWGLWTGADGAKPNLGYMRMYTQGSQRFDIGRGGPRFFNEKHLYAKDIFVWTKGTHTIYFGGDFKRQMHNWLFEEPGGSGGYHFGLREGSSTSVDAQYGVTGSTFTSLLMAIAGQAHYSVFPGTALNLRRQMFAFFAEDNWKATRKLTLTLGLRYDYIPPFEEMNGMMARLNFNTGRIRLPADAPADRLAFVKYAHDLDGTHYMYEPNKLQLSPRFGLAIRPFNDNRTAIRGGYGVFYTVEDAYSTTWGSWVVPFAGTYQYNPRGPFWPDRKDRFAAIAQRPIDLNNVIGVTPGQLRLNTPNYVPAYIQQWNLSIERALAKGLVAQASYVGSKGTNLNGQISLDDYDATLRSKLVSFIPQTFTTYLRAKGFNSKFNSMQLTLRKDTAHGLSFLAAYTWGHSLAESSNEDVTENVISQYDFSGYYRTTRSWSNADFDVRQRFVFSGVYRLPLGPGNKWGKKWNGVANGILGGWQVNWILTFSSGYPFTVVDASSRRPDRICNGNLPRDRRNADKWYDYSCFPTHSPTNVIDPATGKTVQADIQGNANANIIRGPGINNLDFGAQKNFLIGENYRFQFRLETFNALNHVNPNKSWAATAVNTFVNTASGSQIRGARDMRQIQAALKFIF